MFEKVCDWIGYVFCEASFFIMPDDLLERCILQSLGESEEDIDGYITVSYADYRWYDQAFFTLGSVLYRIGCAFYAYGESTAAGQSPWMVSEDAEHE